MMQYEFVHDKEWVLSIFTSKVANP
jgi:hypothetical protein